MHKGGDIEEQYGGKRGRGEGEGEREEENGREGEKEGVKLE